MSKVILGNQYDGWQVNDECKVLSLVQPLSLYDKLRKQEKNVDIKFDNIKKIVVGWTNQPLAFCENLHFVVFELETSDHKLYHFEGTKNDITKEHFK